MISEDMKRNYDVIGTREFDGSVIVKYKKSPEVKNKYLTESDLKSAMRVMGLKALVLESING
jgi:hypothetical protein